MYIFYDFETSSKELLGQILTFSFIVTDKKFNIKKEFSGKIKLNRTQLPEMDALLTNRIDILQHQTESMPEPEASSRIYSFLTEQIRDYGYIPLVGFNSNSFDLSFLRNLLIRYGHNPYFDGKLTNLDILFFAQHLAFQNIDSFPWHLYTKPEGLSYYSFKLEQLANAFQLLDRPQTHDAREDVLLLIELTKTLSHQFKSSLSDFKPVQLLSTPNKTPDFIMAKQRVSDYPDDAQKEPRKFKYMYWLKVLETKKDFIVLDLQKYQDKPIIDCLRYINPNKHFFVLEPFTETETNRFGDKIEQAVDDPFLSDLTTEKYFELIKKDWDIEYQIHELGFQRIDQLKEYVSQLLQTPERYDELLRLLLKNQKEPKDKYLIQLFNRVYLNFHPNPKPEYLKKYLTPRYITGEILKDRQQFTSLDTQWDQLNQKLDSLDPAHLNYSILSSLKSYFSDFRQKNHLNHFNSPLS